jgi:hypothetical protein
MAPRRLGHLSAANALPGAVNRLLRVRGGHQRRKGLHAAQIQEVRAPPDHDGRADPLGANFAVDMCMGSLVVFA